MRWMIKPVVESLPEAIVDLTEETLIRVLHVDDDADFLNTAKQILEMQSSFQVETARSVEEAKDKMKEKTFDVIVSDYVMPGKNGLDFLKEFKDSGINIPFIIFTGKGREEIAIKALNLGADAYFNKLGHPETVYGELAHGIRCTVKSKQAEQALKESEEKYHSLFANMLNGFAYCRMIFDEKDKPIDFVYLEVNDAFEKLTGLKKEDVIGKKVTEAIPGTEKANPELLDIYSRVALTGKEEEFEIFFKPLNMWLSISVYSPKKGYFVAVFENITERKKAEEALSGSEEKWRSLAENAPNIIIIVDHLGTIQFINHIVVDARPEEIVGRSIYDFIGPEHHNVVKKTIEQVFLTGEGTSYEISGVGPKGNVSWYNTQVGPIKQDGRIVSATLITTDITERKQAEENLRFLKEFNERIVNSIGDALLIIDPHDYTIISANEVALTQLKLRKEVVIGKTCYETTHHSSTPCKPPNHICPIQEMMETGEDVTVEHTHFDKDNNEIYVEVSAHPIRNHEGKIVQVVHLARDITERKKAEETLKESEEKFKTLAESSPNMIFVNKKGRVVYANIKCEEIMEYKREEFCSPDFDFFNLIAPEFKDSVKLNFMRHMKGEDVSPYEYALITKDGKRIEVIGSTKLVEYDGENAILGIITDITERKKAEESLNSMMNQLAMVNEKLGVVGNLTRHDIRNKLAAVLNNIYLAKKTLTSNHEALKYS